MLESFNLLLFFPIFTFASTLATALLVIAIKNLLGKTDFSLELKITRYYLLLILTIFLLLRFADWMQSWQEPIVEMEESDNGFQTLKENFYEGSFFGFILIWLSRLATLTYLVFILFADKIFAVKK